VTDVSRPAGKHPWQTATVVAIEPRTPRIRSFFFALQQPPAFVPGQHMDVRLVAPDGYEARRSYSIASAPEHPEPVELAIERLEAGEVSTFFHDVVQVGDEIELRGPIGGHFLWLVRDGGPLLLIGGGSGVVPLMSMIRHHAAKDSRVPVSLVTSARTAADLLYLDELRVLHAGRRGFTLAATVTREVAGQPDLASGRIDGTALARVLNELGDPRRVFVCGSNPFVEAVTGHLLDLGIAPDRIRTERFGG
jgi:ferredoxin-NADP reductase